MEFLIFTRKGIRVVEPSIFDHELILGRVALLSVYREVTTGVCLCTECSKNITFLRRLSAVVNPEVSAPDCLPTSPNLGGAGG